MAKLVAYILSLLSPLASAAKSEAVRPWWEQFESTWQEISSWAIWKGLGTMVVYLIGGWKIAYSALMVLLVLDLALGLWRAIKERRADPTTAKVKTLAKLSFYWSLIIAAHQLGLIAKGSGLGVLVGDEAPLSVTLLYLGMTEFMSIVRHVSLLSGQNFNPFQVIGLIKDFKEGKDASRTPDSTPR